MLKSNQVVDGWNIVHGWHLVKVCGAFDVDRGEVENREEGR